MCGGAERTTENRETLAVELLAESVLSDDDGVLGARSKEATHIDPAVRATEEHLQLDQPTLLDAFD